VACGSEMALPKTILAIHCHERFHCMYVILVGLLVFRRMHSYSHLILLSV
jgi:hypothetical protein